MGSLSTDVDAARRHEGHGRVRDAARREGPGLVRHCKRMEEGEDEEEERGLNDISSFFFKEKGVRDEGERWVWLGKVVCVI